MGEMSNGKSDNLDAYFHFFEALNDAFEMQFFRVSYKFTPYHRHW